MADQGATTKQKPDTKSTISRCSDKTMPAARSLPQPARAPDNPLDLLANDSKGFHSQQTADLPPDNTSGRRKYRPPRRHINACFHHYRFVIAMLGGMSAGLMLFHRHSMTIAVLSMVNQTHLYLETHPNSTYQDFLDEGHLPGGEFLWNNEVSRRIERAGLAQIDLLL
jgi:hypothetical protein